MTAEYQDYEPPAIIFEAEMEASAGSGRFGPTLLDPLEAEIRGLNWPVETDYLTPKP